MTPKRARIDLDALVQNWRTLCRLLTEQEPTARPIAVVKADAYGHGAPQCVQALLEAGCVFFAVSCIEEALAVRQVTREANQHADVLILGYTPLSQASVLAKEDLIQSLSSNAYALALADEAKKQGVCIRTHVALNTGMNRIGFESTDGESIAKTVLEIESLCNRSSLCIEGIYTHFATADGESDFERSFFDTQATCFLECCNALEARGVHIPYRHACNTSATVCHPELHLDFVRVGILLFGAADHPKAPELSPVMRLEADVVHVHRLKKGESVGYGATYTAQKATDVAVLPIGYADGWMRAMGGAEITLTTKSGAHRVPIIGRICMDQCMIDVTGTDAAVGDTAILFGDAPNQLSALSAHADTIPYEILCLVSSRVTRSYEFTTHKETI